MKYRALVFLLLVGPPLSAAQVTPVGENLVSPLSFAIVPQQAPREVAKRWGPIIQYISKHSGVALQFQTARDPASYQQEMKAGLYDISFISSYYYAAFSKEAGYKAFAQEKDSQFVSVTVVRKDSSYQTVQELAGKQLALPGPTAIVSRLVYTHLSAHNIHFLPHYVMSVDSVYRSVAKGIFAAGQGEMRTFGNMPAEIRDQLRILWSSEPMPPFTFSAHPRAPKEAIQKIQQTMLKMADDPEGLELLKSINMKGIAPAHDSEYETVRKLKLLTLEPPSSLSTSSPM